MAKAKVDTAGIIEVMHRLYKEILEVEEPLNLQFGNGDFRPRIEYFHDAVRALVSGREPERLTVEMLAYDLAALRYIQSMPLGSVHPGGRSPHKHPAVKADRTTKVRLGDLYQQYAVLFAALFKPEADYNYQERTDALNSEVERLAAQLAGAEKRNELRQAIKNADIQLADLDKAHLQYASAQLSLFEDGKDIVKKLAARGMNLAGQFVADAMTKASQGLGR